MVSKKRAASGAGNHNVTKRPRRAVEASKAAENDKAGNDKAGNDMTGSNNKAGNDKADIAPAPAPVPAPQLVWSTNRQSLCDSLPEFKAHQGGIHTKGNVPHGVLFGQLVEIGDVMLADKGILHMGGGRKMTESGKWMRNKNYKPKDTAGWEAAKEKQLPILVVMDSRHPNFHNIDITSVPRQKNVEPAYVVLGNFFVTEIWSEMGQAEGGHQIPLVKFMLQRVATETKPTYWTGEYHDPQAQEIQESFVQYTCSDCGRTSPKAFKDQLSLCLNHKCQSFFCVDGEQLQRELLEYNSDFLKWIKPFKGDQSNLPNIIPVAPTTNDGGYGTELRFRTGMICSHCLHCDSRVWFYCWKCSSCGLVRMAEPEPYPLVEIHDETQQYKHKRSLQTLPTFSSDQTTIFLKEGLVTKFTHQTPTSVRTIYLITEANGSLGGSVVHERPSPAALKGIGGADELWKEIQEPGVASNLRRYPARNAGNTVQKLTRHFTQNFGFHYEYGVKVDDTSFNAAPDVVLKSLVQLSHMGRMAVNGSQEIVQNSGILLPEGSTLCDPWQQPNEVLVLAYMEKDHISWHDDGEAQLDGTISTMSLGSPSTMKLRMKSKKADKATGTSKTAAVHLLDLYLQHGDVVTMCDTRLQALTDHCVVPFGIRRFAVTSRVIRPEYYLETKAAKKLKEQGLTIEAMQKSAEIPARAANFTFEGTRLNIASPHTSN